MPDKAAATSYKFAKHDDELSADPEGALTLSADISACGLRITK